MKETLGLAGFQQQQLVGLGELIHVPTENITGQQSENKAAALPVCPALAIGNNGQACLDDVLGVRGAGDKWTRRTDVCSALAQHLSLLSMMTAVRSWRLLSHRRNPN